jgi:hypothetical protein
MKSRGKEFQISMVTVCLACAVNVTDPLERRPSFGSKIVDRTRVQTLGKVGVSASKAMMDRFSTAISLYSRA